MPDLNVPYRGYGCHKNVVDDIKMAEVQCVNSVYPTQLSGKCLLKVLKMAKGVMFPLTGSNDPRERC